VFAAEGTGAAGGRGGLTADGISFRNSIGEIDTNVDWNERSVNTLEEQLATQRDGTNNDSKKYKTKTYSSADEVSNEIRKAKPKYSPDIEKWYNQNGRISIDQNGIWTYHDWEGHLVSYPNGYPDFKLAGLVIQEVSLNKFEGYAKDFAKADSLAPNGPRSIHNTWHHPEDLSTIQEVDRNLHRRFTHEGGMSILKEER